MKKYAAKRLFAAGMTAVLVGQGAVLPSEAAGGSAELPEPIFSLDFDDLSQNAGESVIGTITAAT